MAFSIAGTADRQILTLEGAVTIRDAQDLAARIAEGLEDGRSVGVNTQSLEDIDTSILQLLCSLRQSVPSLVFDNPSAAFLCAVDRCGLRRELLSVREGL
jgi:anti-anti-sigma regulatory factor